MAKDLYEILGIARGASEDEIKRAYRKLAQKHHPDRNKGDKTSESKFKEINAAYEVLSDKKKRAQYDQFGESAFGGGGGQGFPGGFDFGNLGGFGEGFSDIFETFFSGSPGKQKRGQAGPMAGDDREVILQVTFDEAAFGAEKEIKISRIGECEICSGNGAAPGSRILTCPACHGTGEIKTIRHTIIGQLATRRPCDSCSGTGKVAEKICGSCHGVGRSRVSEKLRVKIPAGISDNSSIRIVGKGDSGLRGGESGDLYVHIQIAPHKLFIRKGADVYSEQEISVPQAILGDTIGVQTIHGAVEMKIPSGTESGKIFRLSGYGVQKLKGSGKGDHFVTIKIKIPQKLSKKEQELYEELAKEQGLKLKRDKGLFKNLF